MIRSVYFPIWPLEPFDCRWDAPRRGLWAERAVARVLWLDGWRITGYRWKPTGTLTDIDLIAANEEMLIFAEIKCRSQHDADPWAEVFDTERVDRLRKAIGEYLHTTRQIFVNLRVDGFLVTPDSENPRKPIIKRREGYLPPASIPGWQGLEPVLSD